ncbi:hypothetical protein C8Q80DRAFT_317940 [Daedaleopsis nitida]|nr:hypothetical protein C8Q80DRAFT_317940 [Daedaleopsis nitida]
MSLRRMRLSLGVHDTSWLVRLASPARLTSLRDGRGVGPSGRTGPLPRRERASHAGRLNVRLGLPVGDAAVLGRVFSHLHRREQINGFLHAVQTIRQERVAEVLEAAKSTLSIPPGLAEVHDRQLRAQSERGLENLSMTSGQTSERMMTTVERSRGRRGGRLVEPVGRHAAEGGEVVRGGRGRTWTRETRTRTKANNMKQFGRGVFRVAPTV